MKIKRMKAGDVVVFADWNKNSIGTVQSIGERGGIVFLTNGKWKFPQSVVLLRDRLEYLRGELRNGQISYGEIAELQSYSDYIGKDDVELLEAAGVPEFA